MPDDRSPGRAAAARAGGARRPSAGATAGWKAKPLTFTVLALVAVLIGGLVEIIPMCLIKENVPTIACVKPYTPLEVLGRDIYIREGCVGCHSQMIRPFRSETERYGEYSKAGEFVYDHPFLWGSKRTGPDLHRVGGKYPDAWHYNHMDDPRSTSPGSIMPRYPWLLTQKLDTDFAAGAHQGACAAWACPTRRLRERAGPEGSGGAGGKGRRRTCKVGSVTAAARPGNHRGDRLPATARHRHQGGAAPAPPPTAATERRKSNA